MTKPSQPGRVYSSITTFDPGTYQTHAAYWSSVTAHQSLRSQQASINPFTADRLKTLHFAILV